MKINLSSREKLIIKRAIKLLIWLFFLSILVTYWKFGKITIVFLQAFLFLFAFVLVIASYIYNNKDIKISVKKQKKEVKKWEKIFLIFAVIGIILDLSLMILKSCDYGCSSSLILGFGIIIYILFLNRKTILQKGGLKKFWKIQKGDLKKFWKMGS